MSDSPILTLYRGFPPSNKYTWSPFVTKLECRLRFHQRGYSLETGHVHSAPRRKIPYMTLSCPDTPVESLDDTSLIINRLVQDGLLPDLNSSLEPRDKALDLSLRALLEDKLYFYRCHEIWMQNFYTMRPTVFGHLPYPLELLLGQLTYNSVKTMLWGQGAGRFSPTEIANFRSQIWDHVNALVCTARPEDGDEEPFWVLGGKTPTEADATLFGFVASTLVCDATPTSRDELRRYTAVMDYAERIHRRYFSDYVFWDIEQPPIKSKESVRGALSQAAELTCEIGSEKMSSVVRGFDVHE